MYNYRICLVGERSSIRDEGMNNITLALRDGLLASEQHVYAVSSGNLLCLSHLSRLRRWNPHIIQLIHGPTIRSFLLLKIIKYFLVPVRTAALLTRPFFPRWTRWLLPVLKPDLLLFQSKKSKKMFSQYGWDGLLLPNGVDTREFKPVSLEVKNRLRKRYGISQDKFVILHVGHITRNRGLLVLEQLVSQSDIEILVVGAITIPADKNLKERLRRAGCTVWHRYIERTSEIYQLADCYIFPVPSLPADVFPSWHGEVGSIEMPLSVLEALSTNIAVLTTRFGSLPEFFGETGGLYFFDTVDELIDKLSLARKSRLVETRKLVMEYDWKHVIERLLSIYSALINDSSDS